MNILLGMLRNRLYLDKLVNKLRHMYYQSQIKRKTGTLHQNNTNPMA